MLEKEELARYSRQMILPEFGIAGQEALKNARVLMIGAGGLGCPALQYLVAAGVGMIGIVDDDEVSLSNLHRQILYSAADLGKKKAFVAKERLQALNPFVKIVTFTDRLTSQNAASLLADFDLIIDGSDNFGTRYLVNDTCVAISKPLVFGSIYKFEGQVSVFNYRGGPNYRDIYPVPPAENEVPNCSEIGVLPVLPGIIGLYMANEAIKVICDIGENLSGKLMLLDALGNSVNIFKIGKGAYQQPKEEEKHVIPSRAEEKHTGNEISLSELEQWLEADPQGICLVDVREAYEFEEFNIGGINISLYELTEKTGLIPDDKTLVLCCETGQRSRMAVKILEKQFPGKLYNIKNGIRSR